MTYDTLLSAEALTALMARHTADARLLVCDCRFDLAQPDAGRQSYDAGHLPGAVYLHLDGDLSGPKTGRNGRHPLPERAHFAARLAALGARDDTQLVLYDAHGGMFAARAWWMLRWVGHRAAAVLDGGLPAWLAAGQTVTPTASASASAPPAPARVAAGGFSVRDSLVGTVDHASLRAGIAHPGHGPLVALVDARAPDRFRGENETLDPVGGHIPGAVNRFFKDNLTSDGRFKPAAQLRDEWQALLGEATHPGDVVHHCGSGVTACHNLLALEVAGQPGSRLYPGSWSEWCAQPGAPVVTGE